MSAADAINGPDGRTQQDARKREPTEDLTITSKQLQTPRNVNDADRRQQQGVQDETVSGRGHSPSCGRSVNGAAGDTDYNPRLSNLHQAVVTETEVNVGSGSDIVNTDAAGVLSHGETEVNEEQVIRDFNAIDTHDIDEDADMLTGDKSETEPAAEFQREQLSDATLAALWVRAKTGRSQFRVINGLLYRATPPSCGAANEYQLVVPSRYRTELIRMGHNDLSSGHMGIRKTRERLESLYYWPKMTKMISQHVRSCAACQRVAPRRTRDRAPLEPVQVMHTHPFDDISLDVMGGELPVSSKGNRYVLMIICNVTRWLEAIPLRNLRAQTIADKLVDFFCSKGIARVVRCDNMAGFKSQLLTAVREKLGVGAAYSAPFHYESHGRVERANLTVETMLRKFLHENPKSWDDKLPFLLFALREVPNSSTKFSPAELVYGRKMRGLLSLPRESWTEGDPMQTRLKMPTVKYLQQLNDKIEVALAAARANEREAQQRMKAHYDKVSSTRELKPGEQAYILLPTTANKLLAEWQGPYRVKRRCSNNNYELDLGHRRAILHINCLRKFERPETDSTQLVSMIISDFTDVEADSADMSADIHADPIAETPQWGNVFNIGQQLSAEQRSRMEQLLAAYQDVFSDTPGRTDLIEHVITVTDETPCFQPSYRIPEAMRDKVHDELMAMVANGIIEYNDNTAWNSPLIIVKKADGGIRLVNNFINLNRKTVNEQYVMTNAEELLCRVAGGQYLTKIDLVKSFLQIPLAKESQKYTGFHTPFGNFTYKMMPMGLRTAPFTAQRLVDRVLRGTHKYAGSLIDDILVYSKDFDEHLHHVSDVLDRLRRARLTANVKKCHFASSRIKILGHVVDNGLICPDDDKVAVIASWPRPRNKTQLRSFLGLVNFVRSYVPNYAAIAFPLTELLGRKKPDKLLWGDSEQRSFDQLRNALMSKPALHPPNPNKDYKLYCDSSRTAISCILAQSSDEEGKGDHILAYASRKLVERERKYPITELELMSIVYGLLKFHHYLYAKKVTVLTDHRALQWLNSLVKHSPRLARWSMIIQNYDVTTAYISGKQQPADALNRLSE